MKKKSRESFITSNKIYYIRLAKQEEANWKHGRPGTSSINIIQAAQVITSSLIRHTA